jgi:DNA polymerase alpha subunit B
VIGRIAHDAESSEAGAPIKLNETSVVLEASRMTGGGARVPIRFGPDVVVRGGARGAGGIGVFPGAIVALRGRNGGGGWFQASEILTVSAHIQCLATADEVWCSRRH